MEVDYEEGHPTQTQSPKNFPAEVKKTTLDFRMNMLKVSIAASQSQVEYLHSRLRRSAITDKVVTIIDKCYEHQQEISVVLTPLWCLRTPVSLPCLRQPPRASHVIPWLPLCHMSPIRHSYSHHSCMSLQCLPHSSHHPTPSTCIITIILWLLMIYFHLVTYLS